MVEAVCTAKVGSWGRGGVRVGEGVPWVSCVGGVLRRSKVNQKTSELCVTIISYIAREREREREREIEGGREGEGGIERKGERHVINGIHRSESDLQSLAKLERLALPR